MLVCLCTPHTFGTLWNLKAVCGNNICQAHVLVGHRYGELKPWIWCPITWHSRMNCQKLTCINNVTHTVLCLTTFLLKDSLRQWLHNLCSNSSVKFWVSITQPQYFCYGYCAKCAFVSGQEVWEGCSIWESVKQSIMCITVSNYVISWQFICEFWVIQLQI